jgi:hypothetical protein
VDLVAPCAADGRLLKREYHVHLRRMARVKDVQGVIVNGPAGEAAILDRDTRMKILKVAVSASPAGFPLLAAIPADIIGIAEESQMAMAAGATGIVLIGAGTAEEDGLALTRILESIEDALVMTWDIPVDVAANTPGVAAIIADTVKEFLNRGNLPVMLTDRTFDLKAIADGNAIGAVLACANIAEAHWGKVFRYADNAPDKAELIFSERVGVLRDGLLSVGNFGNRDARYVAAAIKHGLFTMTQNTSAATLQPLVDIGDEARSTISEALVSGRLMPGMV